MNSKYKILASNTMVFAVGNVLIKFISFFLMPLYTSVLTTAQYGEAELLNNTIEIILPIATLCIVEALYRFSIDQNVDYDVLFMTSLYVIIIGNIIVGMGCIIFYFITGYWWTIYFYALFITTTFYKLTTQFARGLGHVKRFVTYGVINSLVLVISNVLLLVVFKGGISAYLLSFCIGYGSSTILALILSKEYKYFKFGVFNKIKLKELLQYSIPSIPNMLSWWVNGLSDRYIVLFYCGANTAGLYTAASKLPSMINLVTSIFQQAWQYSTVTEMDSKDNKSFFSNVFRIYTFFCVVVCSGIIIFNKLICKVLLQADFYFAWKFVPFLLLAATFGCIGTYFGTFYNAVKKNNMLMVSTLVGAIENIILNIMLIPKFGGMGAAIATVISYFVIMLIRMIDVRRFVALDVDLKRFFLQFTVLFIEVIAGSQRGSLSIIISVVGLIVILSTEFELIKQGMSFAVKIIKTNK